VCSSDLFFFARVLVACDAPHGVPVTDVHYVPDCGFNNAALAVSDDGAFAAWHYTHAGFGTITGTNYGAPLDANGRSRVNEELPFDGFSSQPSIASDGHDFLYVLSHSGQTSVNLIHADGTVEPSQPIAVPKVDGKALVVWTGSDYLVVTPDLMAIRVSRVGHPGNVNTLTTGATLAALSKDLVIWKRGSTFEAAPIGGGAAVSLSIPPTSWVSLAGSLAVFEDQSGRVGALRLDSGSVVEIATEAASTFIIPPQVAFDGDSYLVIWNSANVMRAVRVSTNGAVSAPFTIGSGTISSAVPTRDGIMIAYAAGCGFIATRTMARGTSTTSKESVVSLHADSQIGPRIAATQYGHQMIWYESNVLYTRFVSTSGPTGPVTRLSQSSFSAHGNIVPFMGGSAIVWDDGGAIRLARFGAAGNLVAESDPIPFEQFIFGVALAASGDELFVVVEGEQALFKKEIKVARIDANGALLQEAALSNPGEDGFDPIAASDGTRDYAGWRNGGNQLVVVEMPRNDLRQPTRFMTNLPSLNTATVGAFVPGDDPLVLWTNGDVHAVHYRSELDELLANGRAFNVTVFGNRAYWIEVGTTTAIRSAPISRTQSPTDEACFNATIYNINFDIRNGAIDAIAYANGPQLHVQLRGIAHRRGALAP